MKGFLVNVARGITAGLKKVGTSTVAVAGILGAIAPYATNIPGKYGAIISGICSVALAFNHAIGGTSGPGQSAPAAAPPVGAQ